MYPFVPRCMEYSWDGSEVGLKRKYMRSVFRHTLARRNLGKLKRTDYFTQFIPGITENTTSI
jgi:hypothetical protein